VTEKAVEQSNADVFIEARAEMYHWYGDPVQERKAAGRLCSSHNRAGVANIP